MISAQPYLFSLEAVSTILADCYSHKPDKESGGILVGPKSFRRVITDVIPSTKYAERGYAHYFSTEMDARLINQQLRVFQRVGKDFKGDYHSHPGGLTSLSEDDEKSRLEILQSSNYKVNNLTISIIVAERNNQFPLYGYEISLNHHGELVINRIDIRVMPIKLIEEFLDCFEASPTPNKEKNNESTHSKHDDGRDNTETTELSVWI